jgi:predicted TIM-barrel fold metal-dependent hydrolase
MPNSLARRRFLASSSRLLGAGLLGASFGGLALSACTREDPTRYTEADIDLLSAQKADERARSGKGPFGPRRYRGYRGLAELPWFELDSSGVLRCVDESVPKAIDFHCHFGMSMLFEPSLDLQARTDRVRHLLDCDGTNPGCELDLDIYVNGNFTEGDLRQLRWDTVAQAVWGSDIARTQTVPNLLAEMEATRVESAVILPIVLDLPFGDNLEEHWRAAIQEAGAGDRLWAGASVHPRDPDKIEQLRAIAESGARVLKMHPTVQAFYPDDPDAMEVYDEAQRLGLVIFFHGGRAGIEPESRHRYALPRHYEGAISSFPDLPFVLGHAGARDGAAMLEIGLRYENAWFGIHGQGVTHLDEMIRRSGGERMLFGTDWPFYHLATSLAKVLIVTRDPGRSAIRRAILRGNAERLLGIRRV